VKLNNQLVASLAFAGMLLISSASAVAATVDFSRCHSWGCSNYQGNPDIYMTPLEIGQSGNISVEYGVPMNYVSFKLFADLPSNSIITLSYAIDPLALSGGFDSNNANYIKYYDENSNDYTVWSSDNPGDVIHNSSYGPAAPLVSSTTEVSGPDMLTVVFKNMSAQNARFESLFLGVAQWYIGEGGQPWHLTGHYSVTSAVPLPATLPLFGAGLTALAAHAARRRKAGQNTAA
jgi:hypothetical protein